MDRSFDDAQLDLPQREHPWRTATVFVLGSLVAHAVAFVALSRVPERPLVKTQRPVELVMVEVAKPPPPPPPVEEKKPEPPKAPPRPPPVKTAVVAKPPPPPTEAPPPPNDTPPPDAKPAPLVVGISMSSTTTAGGFAAPVGNTAYGKTDTTAKAPSEVKPYSAPKYVPSYQVDREPRPLGQFQPPYPDEARRAGIEDQVTLSVTIDPEGKVVAVKALNDPGYGLKEAAVEAMKRVRFTPATKGGEPVSTEIKYTYTFVLD